MPAAVLSAPVAVLTLPEAVLTLPAAVLTLPTAVRPRCSGHSAQRRSAESFSSTRGMSRPTRRSPLDLELHRPLPGSVKHFCRHLSRQYALAEPVAPRAFWPHLSSRRGRVRTAESPEIRKLRTSFALASHCTRIRLGRRFGQRLVASAIVDATLSHYLLPQEKARGAAENKQNQCRRLGRRR